MLPVCITPLERISVSGGDVLHALKASDPSYLSFGEAYFSIVNPGKVKAWKRHRRMTMNIVVPSGSVKFVLTKSFKDFMTIALGEGNYSRLTVPPGIWFGFQGISLSPSLVLNISDIEHDPSEADKLPQDKVEFDWS